MRKHESFNIHFLVNLWKAFWVYHFSVTVVCPSNLMVLINPALLKKTAYFTFFHCSLPFPHFRRGIILRDPYFAFLTCWNVKKRCVRFINRYNFRIDTVATIIQQFNIFLSVSDAFLFLVLRLWRTQRQTTFFICNSS